MPKKIQTVGRPRTRRQKGGILPLTVLIPAFAAGEKTVALGVASAAAS